ncbi:outer membrane beta-barrel protein [Asaia sp. VD9]|uniref:outer membrane beta-barrel protein n=1 Tax=Asaia sp. VD9 TaxID=3081235 RepID=UPI0030183102
MYRRIRRFQNARPRHAVARLFSSAMIVLPLWLWPYSPAAQAITAVPLRPAALSHASSSTATSFSGARPPLASSSDAATRRHTDTAPIQIKERGRATSLRHRQSIRVPPPRRSRAPHDGDYWEGIEAHMTVEGGIAGNPWTRSARNFGQFYLDRANTLTLNQILGTVSHAMTDIGAGYRLGFVAEAMYGSDSRFDVTIGMGDRALSGMYQWAPTQAHIDQHTPWLFGRGIDFQIGQSYGLMGTEGTAALSRPFYSFNYSSDFIVPFQTVGVIATAHIGPRLDGILGVDAGNSTTFGQSSNNNRPKGYLGVSFTHLLGDRLDGHLIGRAGPQGHDGDSRLSPEGWVSAGIGEAAAHRMQVNADLLLAYHPSKTLSVTFGSTWLHDEVPDDDAWGSTAYLAWDMTPALRLNLRGEVFRDNTGVLIAAYPGTTSFGKQLRNQPYPFYAAPPTTYGDLTLGLRYEPGLLNRYRPLGRVVLRPEIRVDQSLNGTRPFNRDAPASDPIVRNGDPTMLWFSCDMIWSF